MINFDEFLYLMSKMIKDKFDIEQEVREAWQVFDIGDSGSMPATQLAEIMTTYGDRMNDN